MSARARSRCNRQNVIEPYIVKMTTVTDSSCAREWAAEFEACGHKQLYWVERAGANT